MFSSRLSLKAPFKRRRLIYNHVMCTNMQEWGYACICSFTSQFSLNIEVVQTSATTFQTTNTINSYSGYFGEEKWGWGGEQRALRVRFFHLKKFFLQKYIQIQIQVMISTARKIKKEVAVGSHKGTKSLEALK